jgi:hypothetical protein
MGEDVYWRDEWVNWSRSKDEEKQHTFHSIHPSYSVSCCNRVQLRRLAGATGITEIDLLSVPGLSTIPARAIPRHQICMHHTRPLMLAGHVDVRRTPSTPSAPWFFCQATSSSTASAKTSTTRPNQKRIWKHVLVLRPSRRFLIGRCWGIVTHQAIQAALEKRSTLPKIPDHKPTS